MLGREGVEVYTIGEISKIVKTSVDALRYYDEISLLKPIHVEESNRYRYYSKEQVSQLLLIIELRQYGFSLDTIRELLHNGVYLEKERLKLALNVRLQQGILPVIFEILEQGARDFVVKPFQEETIIDALIKVFDESYTLQEQTLQAIKEQFGEDNTNEKSCHKK
jgi:DNA-binding transcriptional MerR regulator